MNSYLMTVFSQDPDCIDKARTIVEEGTLFRDEDVDVDRAIEVSHMHPEVRHELEIRFSFSSRLTRNTADYRIKKIRDIIREALGKQELMPDFMTLQLY